MPGKYSRAPMSGSAIFSLEAHCDPLLVFQLAAYRFPTVVNASRLQLAADRMHQVVGQQGNEQMAFYTGFLLMEVGAHPQFALEAAEHRLQISQHGVGAP